jgi:hypothetical protein
VSGSKALVAAVLASAGLALALVQRPGDRGLAVDAYLLFLGSIALLVLVRATAGAFPTAGPSELERAVRRRPPSPTRLPELERLEREVALSVQSSFDCYLRLRQTLREIAAERLERHGVDLDVSGGEAEEILGPAAWTIVRPDLERPHDRMARGVPLGTVQQAVSSLEGL